ncbi:MAG: hypothetical protein ACOX8M_01620 [Marvinbryantia sp.]|jgi:hypothetical protein
MKEMWKAFFQKDWSLPEKILLLTDVLLAGVLIGWLTSPLKSGIFSNNKVTSITGSTGNEDIFEEDEV